MAVIKDHQNDVKEFNTDTKSEKYHQFTNQIKELIYSEMIKKSKLRIERAANRDKVHEI
jgi:hypothetical protein